MSNMKMVSLIAATDAKARDDFGKAMVELVAAVAALDLRIQALARDVAKLKPQ